VAYDSPAPPTADRIQFELEMRRFFAEMAELMGLPAGAGDALAGSAPIRCCGGFLCRFEVATESHAAVRPQVLLPIPVRELAAGDVERLLTLQEALAVELRWRVGLSRDGMLQLTTMDWIDDPQHAVFAVELGRLLERDAMRELLNPI